MQDGFIIDTTSGRCLQGELSRDLSLKPCDPENKRQRWRFRTYNDVYFKLITSEPVSSIDISVLNKFSQDIQLAQKKRVKYKDNYRLSDTRGQAKETDAKASFLGKNAFPGTSTRQDSLPLTLRGNTNHGPPFSPC